MSHASEEQERITKEGLWATVPLMDPGNVGKYVWTDWNGNGKSPSIIQKIGRTNIHCGRNRTSSYRVDVMGAYAVGSENDFSIHAWSNQYVEEEAERRELVAVYLKMEDRVIRTHDIKLLRDVVWCVGGLLGDD